MYFRLLKRNTKEHDITTTESNSLKDGDNQCNNIEREGNSAAVIILIALIALIIIAVFSIVIYMKIKGHTCKKCTFVRQRNKDTHGKWLFHHYISYALCKNRLFKAFYQRLDLCFKRNMHLICMTIKTDVKFAFKYIPL